MEQQFTCTQIQYHAKWTKFYFSAISSTIHFNLSVTELRCRKYKENSVYSFVIPLGEDAPELCASDKLILSNIL